MECSGACADLSAGLEEEIPIEEEIPMRAGMQSGDPLAQSEGGAFKDFRRVGARDAGARPIPQPWPDMRHWRSRGTAL